MWSGVLVSVKGAGLGSSFSHAFSRELKSVGVVHEAVEDSVGERRVADDVVPALDGDLAGHTLRHRMRFNAYNREPGPNLGDIDDDRVSAPIAFDHTLGAGKRDRATIERLFTPDRTSRL